MSENMYDVLIAKLLKATEHGNMEWTRIPASNRLEASFSSGYIILEKFSMMILDNKKELLELYETERTTYAIRGIQDLFDVAWKKTLKIEDKIASMCEELDVMNYGKE